MTFGCAFDLKLSMKVMIFVLEEFLFAFCPLFQRVLSVRSAASSFHFILPEIN